MKRAILALLAAMLPAVAASASMLVPVDVQTDLLINIGKHDRSFDAKGAILGVIYQEDFPESVVVKNEVIAEVKKRNLPLTCVALEARNAPALRKKLIETNATIVYVAPLRALNIAEIASLTRLRGIRSATGMPEYVDLGIAVGIGLRNRRPLIIINLAGARAEGSDFSSQLLSLARIVGPLR